MSVAGCVSLFSGKIVQIVRRGLFEGPNRMGLSSGATLRIALLACLATVIFQGRADALPQGKWELPAVQVSSSDESAIRTDSAIGPDGERIVAWTSTGKVSVLSSTPNSGPADSMMILSTAYTSPVVQIGPDGATLAAWVTPTGQIEASTHARGEDWKAPEILSGPVDYPISRPRMLTVAMGGNGRGIVVWADRADESSVLQASIWSIQSGFGPAQVLSSPGASSVSPQAQVGIRGQIVVAWESPGGPGSAIQAVTGEDGLGSPVKLGEGSGPRVDVAPSGSTAVGWSDTETGQPATAIKRPGATFKQMPRAPFPTETLLAGVGLAKRDRAYVLGLTENRVGGRTLSIVRRTRTGWKRRQVISDPLQYASPAAISTARNGTVNLAWSTTLPGEGENSRVVTAKKLPGLRFGKPQVMPTPGAINPSIATGESGRAAMSWTRATGPKATALFVFALPDQSYCGRAKLRIKSAKLRRAAKLVVVRGRVSVGGRLTLRRKNSSLGIMKTLHRGAPFRFRLRVARRDLRRKHLPYVLKFQPGLGCNSKSKRVVARSEAPLRPFLLAPRGQGG